jgi:hypothetical protein
MGMPVTETKIILNGCWSIPVLRKGFGAKEISLAFQEFFVETLLGYI